MMVEDLFIELVVLFVAIAPFVAIWRYPASLLSKSLATVVALLFFMIILLGLLRSVARDYNQRPIIKSMQTIGRLLSEYEAFKDKLDRLRPDAGDGGQ